MLFPSTVSARCFPIGIVDGLGIDIDDEVLVVRVMMQSSTVHLMQLVSICAQGIKLVNVYVNSDVAVLLLLLFS